jgi:hypothetical protein
MEVSHVSSDQNLAVTRPQASAAARASVAASDKAAADVTENTPSTVVTLHGEDQAEPDSGDDFASHAKSFAYGVLGLGRPKSAAETEAETPEEKRSDELYSAGRLVIDGMALGTIISLLA